MHRSYVNEDITVFWDSDKCRHARMCVSGSPKVFEFTIMMLRSDLTKLPIAVWQSLRENRSESATMMIRGKHLISITQRLTGSMAERVLQRGLSIV